MNLSLRRCWRMKTVAVVQLETLPSATGLHPFVHLSLCCQSVNDGGSLVNLPERVWRSDVLIQTWVIAPCRTLRGICILRFGLCVCVCVESWFTDGSEGDHPDSDRRGHWDVCVSAAGIAKHLTHLVHWPEYFPFTYTHTHNFFCKCYFFSQVFLLEVFSASLGTVVEKGLRVLQ